MTAKSRVRQPPAALIVLTSLTVEGTPIMARDLCREWAQAGIRAEILTLFDSPDDMAAEFAELAVPVHRARVPRTGRNRYLAIAVQVAEVARRVRPRAVLSMLFGWHAFVAMGARFARVPRMAAHVGTFPVAHGSPGFWKFQAEVLAGRLLTDRLICCSEYVRRGVLEHFPLSPGSTTVVHNGCDLEQVRRRAQEARRARRKGEPFRVGMVARLDSSKDHETLIAAAALLSRSRPTELWLVGDGSDRAALEEYTRARVADVVRFLGVRRDVPELLGQLDAFAYSVRPDEGLGIALIEAMAARLPIVATDVGACREVLEGGSLGTLVPYRDAEAMARALGDVAAFSGVAERTERAARSAEARFSLRAMADGYARELGIERT